MLQRLASVDALASWLGQEVSALDAARAGALLDAASALVRGEAGQLWPDYNDVPEDVRVVVLQVAQRVYRNPDGFVSEGVGPFSGSRGNDAALGFYLTPPERKILGRYAASAKSGGLFVIRTSPTDRSSAVRYVNAELADGQPGGDWPVPWQQPDADFPR